MSKGAVHVGLDSTLKRRLRWDILDRMRKLVESGTYERPRWLEWVERAPPLETRNILHSDRVIRNPYIPLVETLLRKYPHLRFEQCYNPENKWTKGQLYNGSQLLGHDEYAADHPVMQFVAYQLSLMNQGISKSEAFKKTEAVFYKKRLEIERKIKVAMALGLDQGAEPLYTTGFAYWNAKIAQERFKFLTHVKEELQFVINSDAVKNALEE